MMDKLIAMRNSKKKGFTLIELIVVIAILAILAALAVPAYNGLKKNSALQVAESNVRSVYTAYKAAEALNKENTKHPTTADVAKMLDATKAGETGKETYTLGRGTINVPSGNATVSWAGNINGYDVWATCTTNGTATIVSGTGTTVGTDDD